MENETRDETLRLQDQSLRAFDVEVLLTKHLTLPDTFNAGFTKEDGTSLIKLASNIRVDTASGTFHVDLNSQNEMALIRMRVEARVPTEARNKICTIAMRPARLVRMASVVCGRDADSRWPNENRRR